MERTNDWRKFESLGSGASQEQPRQWKGKTGGGKFGQKSLFFILRRMNVAFLYPILFIVVPFYMLFARKGYLSIMRYFRQCHRMSGWNSFRQTFVNHLLFGQIVLDKFAALVGNIRYFTADITGQSCLDELMKKNTGFIVACSHIGNFELSGLLYRHQQKKTYALVYDGENSNLQQVRIEAMRQANIEAVSVCDDMSHLFTLKNALENGDIISIPCDRIYGSSKKIKCEFLGREAYFPLAPFRLATQMNVPVIAFFMMKEKSTKYHAYVFPVEPHSEEPDRIKKAEHLAASFVRSCEDILRKYPQQWFNFYDFWKL